MEQQDNTSVEPNLTRALAKTIVILHGVCLFLESALSAADPNNYDNRILSHSEYQTLAKMLEQISTINGALRRIEWAADERSSAGLDPYPPRQEAKNDDK